MLAADFIGDELTNTAVVASTTPDPDSDDIFEMRKEIARLKDENIFLKKAAAFFAKEQL